MNDELDKALEWADEWATVRNTTGAEHIKTLADAVRSLRETVKAKDEEIADLRERVDDRDKVAVEWKDACTLIKRDRDQWETKARKLLFKLQELALNPSLDRALNEGDGTYKP